MSRLHLCALSFTAALCFGAWGCIDEPQFDAGTGGDDGGCVMFPITQVASCPETIGENFCSDGGVHVDEGSTIDYSNNPPHSGDHYPVWEQQWGEHSDPVARGNWVHNMEHGGVILLYNCPDGCDAELDILRMVIAQRPDARILMTEDSLLDGPRFAAVSWTWVHEFDTPELDELLCFVDQHFNHAPENVP